MTYVQKIDVSHEFEIVYPHVPKAIENTISALIIAIKQECNNVISDLNFQNKPFEILYDSMSEICFRSETPFYNFSIFWFSDSFSDVDEEEIRLKIKKLIINYAKKYSIEYTIKEEK